MRIILTLRGSSEVYPTNRPQSTKFHLRHLSFPFKHMKMRCIHPRSLAAHLPQNSHPHPKWKESSGTNLQPSLCGWPACKISGDVSCIYNIHIRTNWMPLFVMDTGFLLILLRLRRNKPVLSPSSMFWISTMRKGSQRDYIIIPKIGLLRPTNESRHYSKHANPFLQK